VLVKTSQEGIYLDSKDLQLSWMSAFHNFQNYAPILVKKNIQEFEINSVNGA